MSSADEVPGPRKTEAMLEASREVFEKVAEYIKGELHATSEDYKLMEKLNLVTTEQYKELTKQSTEIRDSMTQLQVKTKELQPYLDQIDVLEGSASELLNTAALLDDYSKRLETKYKELMATRRG